MPCEAGQTAAGASAERRPWRKVRTAQGSVAGNARPPRGADQSHRDESALRARAKAQAGATSAQGGVKRGNLYAQQHRIGTHRPGPASVRVGGTEPRRQRAAQMDGGHTGASRDATVHRIRPTGPLHAFFPFLFLFTPLPPTAAKAASAVDRRSSTRRTPATAVPPGLDEHARASGCVKRRYQRDAKCATTNPPK